MAVMVKPDIATQFLTPTLKLVFLPQIRWRRSEIEMKCYYMCN
jgi:hypothetical protein